MNLHEIGHSGSVEYICGIGMVLQRLGARIDSGRSADMRAGIPNVFYETIIGLVYLDEEKMIFYAVFFRRVIRMRLFDSLSIRLFDESKIGGFFNPQNLEVGNHIPNNPTCLMRYAGDTLFGIY